MVVTGITNSLTFTSLLLVNFVATDILRFEQTLGVLLGPDLLSPFALRPMPAFDGMRVHRAAREPAGAGIGSTFIGILIVFKVTK
jgi:hypothetical protein